MSRDERARRAARDADKALPRAVGPSPVPEPVRPARRASGAHPSSRPAGASGLPSRTPAGAVAAGSGRIALGRAVAALAVPALVDRAAADRQLVVGAIVVILLARTADGPIVWAIAVLLALGVLVGAGFNRGPISAGDAEVPVPGGRGRWAAVVAGAAGLESGIVPAALAFSLALAIRLVPFNWLVLAALVGAYIALDQAVGLERVLALARDRAAERWKAVLVVLATSFLGFAGIASMIDGGLAGVGAPSLQEADLFALAGGDAALATALGFRLARLGPATRREAALSGLGFGAVVATGAGLLRAMAIPQLLGPALLTLIVYLWDALNATTPSIRRDPRWRWQVALLLVLAAVVIGWNLRLRA